VEDLSAGVRAHPAVIRIQLAVYREVQRFTPQHFGVQSRFPERASMGDERVFKDASPSIYSCPHLASCPHLMATITVSHA